MEDLVGLIAVIIFYVIAAGSRKKKAQKQGQKPKQKRKTQQNPWGEMLQQLEAQHPWADKIKKLQREQAAQSQSAPAKKREETVFPPRQERVRNLHEEEGVDPCHEQMLRPQQVGMRLNQVTQEEMHAAGEGVDPCHTGEAQSSGGWELLHDDVQSDDQALARNVLSGVIMSEILERPCERAARQRARRLTYGR